MNKKYKVLIIICGLMLLLIPASFALFKKQVGGDTSVSAADWSITLEQTGVNNSLTVVPEITETTYTLNVKSMSQVDAKYSIVVSNLPSGVQVSLNGVDFPQVSNGSVTFSNAGTILYNAANKTNTHTLTFRGVNGATFVNNQTVTVNVIAEQIVSS